MAEPKRMVDRLDAFQRRHRVIGYPLAVIYKFFDDQGQVLAALITFYAFISIFPLLLLSSSILGFVLQGNPELQAAILKSARAQFPLLGDLIGQPEAITGSTMAVVIGVLGAAYGAQRVAAFTQNAMNVAWMVPRNARPNPFALRIKGFALIGTGGIGVLVVTAVAALANNAEALGARIDRWLSWLIVLGIVVVSTGVFVAVFRLGSSHPLTIRQALPGAVFTAVGWQVLQGVGNAYVSTILERSSITNGIFAIVIGMFAYMYLGAIIVVLGVEINVVRVRRLYPRASWCRLPTT